MACQIVEDPLARGAHVDHGDVAYFAAMAMSAALLLTASTQYGGTVYSTAGSDCRVSVVDGAAEHSHWMRCGFDVVTGDAVRFYALAWPFEGETYRVEQLVFMVAAPAGIALAFLPGHVGYALARRQRSGERRYVVDEEPTSAPDGPNLWLDIHLLEMAALLHWPDQPAALVGPGRSTSCPGRIESRSARARRPTGGPRRASARP